MNKQKRLLLGRNIFLLIIIITFGIIIISEKSSTILIPKAEEKFNNYLEKTYPNQKDFIKHPVTYNNTVFSMKISSKKNKHHYFYLEYHNHKITDTYKKDYLEGKQLLNNIKNKMEKNINNKTNIQTEVIIPNTLNNYTDEVQERIINEDNLLSLKFYIIKTNLLIKNWTEEEITKEIVKTINNYLNKDINPKFFTIIITNNKDITQSIEINDIKEDFIKNIDKEKIIGAIIDGEENKLLSDNRITYKYLN